LPSGLIVMSCGVRTPSWIWDVTVLVAALMTDTVLVSWLAT